MGQKMSLATQAFSQGYQHSNQSVSTPVSVLPLKRIVIKLDLTEWNKQLTDRLSELVSLHAGWDGYNGQPVDFTKAYFASEVLKQLYVDDVCTPALVPGSDGTLQAEWHACDMDIELDILDVNKVNALYVDNRNETETELEIRANFTPVREWLQEMARRNREV